MSNLFKSTKYNNITISGRAAAGSSTLANNLSKKLNWVLFSGGELVRQYVKEQCIPLERTTYTSDEFHIGLDELIKNRLKNGKNQIIESWLAGFDAKGIAKIFKIFVTCSDSSVRTKRIMKRDKMTREKAEKHIRTREEENLKKWEKLYKTRDFWDPKYYDLVINTCNNGIRDTLEVALEAIGYYK